jgi:hypothetical protein
MPKKDIERLIGRAVIDPVFREKLFKDPEKTIRTAGLKLTEEELAALKEIDAEKAKAELEGMATLAEQPWM